MSLTNRRDFSLLTVFEAIYCEGNLTRAAEKLHITQPAISHTLNRLRELFKDPLFIRRGHEMVPTPFTKTIIEPIRSSLRSLQSILNDVTHFDPSLTQRTMTIGLPSSEEMAFVPELMRKIVVEAPGIDIVTVRNRRSLLESLLSAGTIDVSVDILLDHPDEVIHQRIAQERLVVVMRKDHPDIDDHVDLDTYTRLEHILVSSRRKGPAAIDVELSRISMRRHIRLRCMQYSVALQVVNNSDLLLTMPEYDAHIMRGGFDVKILPLPIEPPLLDLYVYWHTSTTNEPGNRWLRKQIIDAFLSVERIHAA